MRIVDLKILDNGDMFIVIESDYGMVSLYFNRYKIESMLMENFQNLLDNADRIRYL